MNRQDIPVVFSTDHNFIMPTYVAMSSLLANASRRCEIYLLVSEDVTYDDKEIINRLAAAHDAGLTFIAVGTVFDNSFCVRGITKATYFRLLIPWIIPDRDKVIYLDGDIVVTGDIAQLYDYPADPACLICGVRTPGFSTSDKIRKEICRHTDIQQPTAPRGGLQAQIPRPHRQAIQFSGPGYTEHHLRRTHRLSAAEI